MSTVIVIDKSLGVGEDEVIQVTSLAELAKLNQLIERRLSGASISLIRDKYIKVEDAIKLANSQNINLPRTTLIGALINNNIPGVRKPKGRWEMPEGEFIAWLARYKDRKATE